MSQSLKNLAKLFAVIILVMSTLLYLHSRTSILRSDIAKLEEERKQLISERDKLTIEIDRYKELIVAKNARVSELEAVVATAKVESAQAEAAYVESYERLKKLLAEFTPELSGTIETPTPLSTCLDVLAACDATVKAKNQEIEAYQKLVESLNDAVAARDTQLGNFENLVSVLRAENTNLESQVRKYQKIDRRWLPSIGFGVGVTCGVNGCAAGPTVGVFWRF